MSDLVLIAGRLAGALALGRTVTGLVEEALDTIRRRLRARRASLLRRRGGGEALTAVSSPAAGPDRVPGPRGSPPAVRTILPLPVPHPADAAPGVALDGEWCLSLETDPAAHPPAPEETRLIAAVAALACRVLDPPAAAELPAPSGPRGPSSAAKRHPEISLPAASGAGRLLGRSESIRALRALLRRLGPTELPVLVVGESGTGKELVARALHEESGRRAGPFVPENCAAIPETLFESLLFGHVRGAFTGAERYHDGLLVRAAGGTLFLDEIGEMPPHLQAKLLRVLQENEVTPLGGAAPVPLDLRLVGATNRPIDGLLRSGRLRQDLYYRIRGVLIEVPPLRCRPEDIPLLARSFLARSASSAKGRHREPPGLDGEALRALLEHDWPGNVRELAGEIERALALSGGGKIRLADLSSALRGGPARGPGAAADAGRAPSAERRMIERALLACGGSVSGAAREIGWSRQKLYRRMRRLALRPGSGRNSA